MLWLLRPLLSVAVAPGDLVALEFRRSLGLTSPGKVLLSPWHPHPTRSKLNLEEEGFTTILRIQKPNDSPSIPLISSPLPFQRIKGTGREISVSVLPCDLVSALGVVSLVQCWKEVICLKVPAQWVWEPPGQCAAQLGQGTTKPDMRVLPALRSPLWRPPPGVRGGEDLGGFRSLYFNLTLTFILVLQL